MNRKKLLWCGVAACVILLCAWFFTTKSKKADSAASDLLQGTNQQAPASMVTDLDPATTQTSPSLRAVASAPMQTTAINGTTTFLSGAASGETEKRSASSCTATRGWLSASPTA